MDTNKTDKHWDILQSEYLHRRPWLTVRRDTVRLPDGTVNPEFYILEYPEWVNVIALTADGLFVLVRQYRHGIRKTLLELVAGVVDPTDTCPLEAARRELLEETGFGDGQWEPFLTVAPNASAMTNCSHTFLARGVRQISTQHLEKTKDIDVVLLSRDEVYGRLQAGEFVQGLMAAPLWKFFCEDEQCR